MKFLKNLYYLLLVVLDSLRYYPTYTLERSSTSILHDVLRLEKKYRSLLTAEGIISVTARAHFWSQIVHESNLRLIRENMNYSANRLLVIFRRYFTPELAVRYARKPERIANRVYANRMGNRSEASGDGWKYRGAGFLQHTGRSEYIVLDKIIDGVLDDPDKLLEEEAAIKAALSFWGRRKLNKLSDNPNNVTVITRLINGGTNGIEDRQKWFNFFIKNLK